MKIEFKKSSFVACLLAGSTVFYSCTKTAQEEVLEETKVTNSELSFSLAIREGVDVSNFRVGQPISMQVKEIVDTGESDGFIYYLRAVGNDATRHQVLGTDYIWQTKSKEGKLTDISRVEIANAQELPELFVTPQVAGTFQLDFELQKFDPVTGKNVGKPVSKQFVFNAVKINFQFPTERIRNSNLFYASRHRRRFMLSIDDGNREYDTYLSNSTSTNTYVYATSYVEARRTGTFFENNWIEFRNPHERDGAPIGMHEVAQTVTIAITQYLKNGTINIITYKDVRLEY